MSPYTLPPIPFGSLPFGSIWFPAPGSTVASDVDRLFYFILLISTVLFAIVLGMMVTFVVRYRRRGVAAAEPSAHHNTALEIFWSVIPSGIVAVIFFWGFTAYMNMRQPPDDAYEIQVVARKWSWSFTYPNGHVDTELHVPVDRPVRLVMGSDDVIHSLYVPAFRVKMDVVPGRYTTTWFEATKPGEFKLFCAEYCGTQHSSMVTNVVVHESGTFEGWLEEAGNLLKTMPPAEAGKVLYTRHGCSQCHSIDGSAKVGPSFLGVFGTTQAAADGTEITVDENYLRESILEPQARIRAGYKPAMPTYSGRLKDEEISAIIAFIKSLQE